MKTGGTKHISFLSFAKMKNLIIVKNGKCIFLNFLKIYEKYICLSICCRFFLVFCRIVVGFGMFGRCWSIVADFRPMFGRCSADFGRPPPPHDPHPSPARAPKIDRTLTEHRPKIGHDRCIHKLKFQNHLLSRLRFLPVPSNPAYRYSNFCAGNLVICH